MPLLNAPEDFALLPYDDWEQLTKDYYDQCREDNQPISLAMGAVLNEIVLEALSGGGGGGSVDWGDIGGSLSAQTDLNTALGLKAPLASPALTGNPTAPTQTAGNNSTRLATTAFVATALAALVDSAPGTLDTLNELAAALGDDPNLAATLAAQIAATISDTAYDATSWNGVTGVAPSKNAVRDQIESLLTSIAGKQGTLTLTTTGSSGAATLVGNTLNIPQYSGGGGSGTVNSGTQYRLAYYAITGTEVSELAALDPSKVVITDANGVPLSAAISVTELNYLSGASANIQTSKADVTTGTVTVSGTTYTLLTSDKGKSIHFTSASAVTVTVPTGLGAGFNCLLIQEGAGQVTLSPSSTTVTNRQSHTKIAGQGGMATLVSRVANTFYFGGDTAS